jgi:hypothetical protein
VAILADSRYEAGSHTEEGDRQMIR